MDRVNQKGEEAVKHQNVFFNMTYVDDIHLAALHDDVARQNLLTQIAQYGQTPSQLLFKPHPTRYSRDQALDLAFPQVHALCVTLPHDLHPQIVLHTRHKSPLASVLLLEDRLLLLDAAGRCSCHGVDTRNCDKNGFSCTITIQEKHTKRVASGLTVVVALPCHA